MELTVEAHSDPLGEGSTESVYELRETPQMYVTV